MAALCIPLLVACGDRSTHRSADRSQRVVGKEQVAVGDKQALTEQDVATSRTRRSARTRSVAGSSYQETTARPAETSTAQQLAQEVAQQQAQQVTQPVEQVPVEGVKPVTTQPADKPLAQKPVQVVPKPEQSAPVNTVASGPEKVLVEGCVLKQPAVLGAFSVVVGSFTQPESAVTLIKKLGGMGIKPFFVLNEKGMYRLITGTFNDRDEADYQVLKLDVETISAWVLIR